VVGVLSTRQAEPCGGRSTGFSEVQTYGSDNQSIRSNNEDKAQNRQE
jgi:hypothetical protein